MLNVLMIGPDIDSRGGIATVEKQYIEAGIGDSVGFFFLKTTQEGSLFTKVMCACRALVKFASMKNSVDVVHIHIASRRSFERKKLFIKAASKTQCAIILHLHGSEFAKWFFEECDNKKRNEIRDVFNCAHKVIALSNTWKNFLIENICSGDKVILLHNAIKMPEEIRLFKNRKKVLFMGRLNQRKAPDILLNAAKIVIENHPSSEFIFCGDGDISKYKRMSEKLGISDNCCFYGWVSGTEKKSLYMECDYYCLPSRNEGLPMSLLEAMSYGLVPLATPVGGIRETIKHEINGLIFPEEDYKSLAESLSLLFDNEELASELSANAYETISSNFNLSKTLATLLDLYQDLGQRVSSLNYLGDDSRRNS